MAGEKADERGEAGGEEGEAGPRQPKERAGRHERARAEEEAGAGHGCEWG